MEALPDELITATAHFVWQCGGLGDMLALIRVNRQLRRCVLAVLQGKRKAITDDVRSRMSEALVHYLLKHANKRGVRSVPLLVCGPYEMQFVLDTLIFHGLTVWSPLWHKATSHGTPTLKAPKKTCVPGIEHAPDDAIAALLGSPPRKRLFCALYDTGAYNGNVARLNDPRFYVIRVTASTIGGYLGSRRLPYELKARDRREIMARCNANAFVTAADITKKNQSVICTSNVRAMKLHELLAKTMRNLSASKSAPRRYLMQLDERRGFISETKSGLKVTLDHTWWLAWIPVPLAMTHYRATRLLNRCAGAIDRPDVVMACYAEDYTPRGWLYRILALLPFDASVDALRVFGDGSLKNVHFELPALPAFEAAHTLEVLI